MKDSDMIFEKYYEDVFRFLRGLSGDENLAEELTQETFYKAIKSLDNFQGNCELRVWLCSIAKNLFYTHYKKSKHITNLEEPEKIEDNSSFVDMIADKDMALQIHKVLHVLKEPYKEIFSLRVFGELSFREIGELFGKSEHWACVTYHRAKTMICDQMKEDKSL